MRYEPTFFVGAEGGTHVGFHPARALGPILVAGDFTSAWLYILERIIGGVLATLLYDRLMAQTEALG